MARTFKTDSTTIINPYTDRVTVYSNNNDAPYAREERNVVNTYEQKSQAMKDRIEELRRQREYKELGIIF